MTTSDRVSFPRDQINVLLFEGIHERAEQALREAGYTQVTRLPHTPPRDELLERIHDARVVGVRSRTKLPKDVLDAAPRLMAVGCFCIGTDQVDLRHALHTGVPVFNAPHSNTRSVAELVIGLAVMLFRGIFPKDRAAQSGAWLKTAKGSHELRGKTLGIVGYGHIGSQVSVLAESMGLRVIYHDIEPKLTLGNARVADDLSALLAQSDLVTLHVPQAPDTVNLMSAERLAQMKPGAFLVNYSRGTVVDVDALAAHLRDGRLGGAAVDVFPQEPKDKDTPFRSPLQGIPTAILTPHIGGSTEEAQETIAVDVADKLVRYLDRGTTVGTVNFPELNLAPHTDCHRVLHIHHDHPGVLNAINSVFAAEGINIRGQHLQTRDRMGYVVLDIEAVPGERILPPLRAIEGTVTTRILY